MCPSLLLASSRSNKSTGFICSPKHLWMLRYLTPRYPYDIQGPQTLAVAQISLTNYKQWDGGGGVSCKICPLTPPPHSSALHLCSPSWPRQASPSLGSGPAHSSRLLLHTFIKRTLRDGDSGGSTLMPLSKAKLLGVFASFSFSSGSPQPPPFLS